MLAYYTSGICAADAGAALDANHARAVAGGDAGAGVSGGAAGGSDAGNGANGSCSTRSIGVELHTDQVSGGFGLGLNTGNNGGLGVNIGGVGARVGSGGL